MKSNNFLTRISRTVAFAVILILSLNSASAQFNIGGPGTNGSGVYANGSSDAPAVPFDGGMSLMLAAAGIGYVSKKVKNRKSL